MASEIILTEASIEIDDEAVLIQGNSIKLKEGQGTYSTMSCLKRAKPVAVHGLDATKLFGEIKFSCPSTIPTINQIRRFKAQGPGRVVRFSGTDKGGNRIGRTLTDAVINEDYEIAIEQEGSFEVMCSGSQLVLS